LVACRGEEPKGRLALEGDDGEVPLYASESLIAATDGRLPADFADQVQCVAVFRPLSEDALQEIARRHFARRAAEVDASDAVIAAIARAAAGAPRHGHEVRALVARVPPGSWNAKAAAAPEKRRRKKGKT
jgi:hypothetical protein